MFKYALKTMRKVAIALNMDLLTISYLSSYPFMPVWNYCSTGVFFLFLFSSICFLTTASNEWGEPTTTLNIIWYFMSLL